MKNFEILFPANSSDGVVELVFHSAGSANALSLEVARELKSVIKVIGKSNPHTGRGPSALLVRSGHPRVFCSGGNLSDYKRLKDKASGLKINREIEAVLNAFGQLPILKMALIEGDVWGGGMEWLARFDVRWAAPSVLLGFWQKRIGLSTGWGGGSCWAKRISEERLRQWLLSAKVFGAWEAQAEGIVERVLSEEMILPQARLFLRAQSEQFAPEFMAWTAKTEAKIFSKLWMGKLHRKALGRWKS